MNSCSGFKAIIIGNGINRLDENQSISWKTLLTELKEYYGIEIDTNNDLKPFPLMFEEMLYKKSGESEIKQKQMNLKKKIRELIERQNENKSGYNEYHRRITELPYNEFLTTNYDYSLEKSMNSEFSVRKDKFSLNREERKSSLKRGYKIDNKTFWHFHGEIVDSRNHKKGNSYPEESIMIGYEQYSDYLEKIQENIKGKSGRQRSDNKSLFIRIRDNDIGNTWLDTFFTHDLDIIGFGFDFSENHLWWLINYRAQFIRNGKTPYDININNNIRYFYPEIRNGNTFNLSQNLNLDELSTKIASIKKSKGIGQILSAFNVELVSIECDWYDEFYEKLIENYLWR